VRCEWSASAPGVPSPRGSTPLERPRFQPTVEWTCRLLGAFRPVRVGRRNQFRPSPSPSPPVGPRPPGTRKGPTPVLNPARDEIKRVHAGPPRSRRRARCTRASAPRPHPMNPRGAVAVCSSQPLCPPWSAPPGDGRVPGDHTTGPPTGPRRGSRPSIRGPGRFPSAVRADYVSAPGRRPLVSPRLPLEGRVVAVGVRMADHQERVRHELVSESPARCAQVSFFPCRSLGISAGTRSWSEKDPGVLGRERIAGPEPTGGSRAGSPVPTRTATSAVPQLGGSGTPIHGRLG